MKIGITYNLKDEISPDAILDSESCEEYDTAETIDAICAVLEKNGHRTVKLGGGLDIVEKIKNENPDFVFNIAENCGGRNRESHIPSILEMLNMPYSGSDPLTLGLTLDKIMAKKIAYQAGIPTPRYAVIKSASDLREAENKLRYPVITKPAWEGSSKGIYNCSKVHDRWALERNARLLLEKYPEAPVLAEEYIEGREVTVAVIGNDSPQVMGYLEVVNKVFPGKDFFYSLEVKRDWKNLVDYAVPDDLGELAEKHMRHYAVSAFREYGCRDIARMDFRISKNSDIFLLEANPLPGLSPEYADIVIMARKWGISYEELIMSILKHALSRYRIGVKDEKNLRQSEFDHEKL